MVARSNNLIWVLATSISIVVKVIQVTFMKQAPFAWPAPFSLMKHPFKMHSFGHRKHNLPSGVTWTCVVFSQAVEQLIRKWWLQTHSAPFQKRKVHFHEKFGTKTWTISSGLSQNNSTSCTIIIVLGEYFVSQVLEEEICQEWGEIYALLWCKGFFF